jgi:hypothetical protein
MTRGKAGDGAPPRAPALPGILEKVARLDPLLVEAAADVDIGLLRWSLSQTPRQRLRSCSRAAATLARLGRAASGRR